MNCSALDGSLDSPLHDALRLQKGQRLAERYEVVRPLGRGGMGEVYVAFDSRLGRQVALKVLPERLQAREEERAVQRFLQQARLAARVSDPAVVQVFDCGVHDNVPFVAQELLSGETLARLIARGPCSVDGALELTREVCRALIAVHAAGVVHRDLKPGNVFLHGQDGDRRQLKLLDFGLARLLRGESLTRTGEVFGTLSYIAPEQLVQTKAARVPSDVYALGCILFELLSGRPPFLRPTRTELRLAVLHDRAPRVDSLAGGIEAGLADVVARALEKRPEQRQRDVGELLQALAPFASAQGADRKGERAAQRPSAGRFELLRVLGRGAHGEVCAFLDKRSGRPVALKRVRKRDLDGLFLLRREFEVLSGLRHAHIVRAYELLEEPEQLSLVLELVEGARLDAFVQEGPQQLRRLHGACVQLCDALSALHALGLAHRDLKPANVLVRASGHVVLVDFGLAHKNRASESLGTGRYMAPETRNGVVGPASDLYALGVTLADVLAALEPAALAEEPALATLLAELSAALRSPTPERRPSAQAVLARLTASATDDVGARAIPAAKNEVPFVGRRHELFVLQAAFQSARLGRSAVVDLSGEPGSGKSALLDAFCRELPRAALVLRGWSRPRCGALAAVIDQLSEHLARRPLAAQHALLPSDLGGLPALYPTLGRVEAVRERSSQARFTTYQSEEVTAAYRALREIFSALARETPTVLVLEDVHASDPGERALLANLLREPDPPALMVVLTRTLELPAAELSALLARSGTAAIALSGTREDGPSFLQQALPERPDLHEALLAQDGDNFHFLGLLVEQARRAGASPERLTLDAAFEALHAALSPAAAALLELVCLSHHALASELLFAAAGAGMHELSDLTALRLVTRVGDGDHDTVAPYHPRVRAWLIARTSAERRRALHLGLLALEHPLLDECARIEHLIGAGLSDQAVARCSARAEQAERERRFVDSAALYRVCLDRLEPASPALPTLRERYAYVLHCQGLSGAAAGALLPLLEHTARDDLAINEQRAGELLLLSGDLQRGATLLNRALARHGEALAEDLISTLQQAALAYAALRERGLGVTPLLAREACDSVALARAELLVATAMSLSHMDLRGLPFVFRGAQAALELGERGLVLKACALLVWSSVSQFPNELVVPALNLCEQLVRKGASPYERALLHVARTEYHYAVGNFLQAEAESERAEHLLVSQCVGVAREISGVRNVQAFLQYSHKGDFRSRIDQTLHWMTEAESVGNAYQLNMLRAAHALAFVARDRPDLARAQLEAAERDWQGGVSLFELSAALFLDVIDRYEGDPEVHHRPAQGRSHILLSPAAQTPAWKGYLELQRAWGTLVVLSGGDYQEADANMLQTALKTLRSLRLPHWDAMADAFEANLYLLVADESEAIRLLERSERGFRALHMLCLAACARRRRGETTGGLVGQRIQREAEAELRDLGVVRVDKWCRAYFSPFELSGTREPLTALTLDGGAEPGATVHDRVSGQST